MAFEPAIGEALRLAVRDDRRTPELADPEIVRLVRDTPSGLLAGLPDAARFHGVAGYTFAAFDGTDLAPETLGRLRALRDRAVFNHLRATADILLLEEVFGRSATPWMVIKGPTLAEPVHGSAQLRSYGDIDVLVPGGHLATAVAALEDAGSTVTDRNWTLIARKMKGEVHVRLPSGTALDLHWHLFNEPERRARFPVDIERLFAGGRTVLVNGRAVPTPALTDTIVYVALHTMHSGGHRLIWLKDLERLLALPGCDARAVVDRARAWRAELVLTSAIRRVELALGTPPLAAEIRRAASRQWLWSAVSSAAWRRAPAEREDGRGSLGRIVARSIRADQRTSLAELLRRAVAHARDRTPTDGGGRLGEDDPRSDRFPSGGPPERSAYFSRVAGEGTHPATTPRPGPE